MARILTCGFELRSSIEVVAQSIAGAGTTISYTGTPRMPGGNGVSCAMQNGGGTGTISHIQLEFPVTNEIYVRVCANGGSLNTEHIRILNAGGAAALLRLSYINGGAISVLSSNGTLGTTTEVVPGGWNLIEIYFKLHSSTGRATIKINGVQVFDFTGNTNPQGLTDPARVHLVNSMSQAANASISFDDIAVNDTTGSENNSWCGDGVVLALLPNANGDSSQWVGSDGNSIDNYLLVDENPFNSDTDYVSANTTGLKDLYNLSALPSIPLSSTIVVVQPIAIARRADPATPSTFDLGIKSSSTEDYQTQPTPISTGYSLYKGKTYSQNPATSAPWSISDIDGLQVGIVSS